jgi:hypothetical protein
VTVELDPAASNPTAPTLPPKPPHRARNPAVVVAVVVVVVVIAVLVALLGIPVQRSFSFSFSDTCDTSGTLCPTMSFPSGADVSGNFSTSGNLSGGLEISDPSGTVYYSVTSSGSFSFTAGFSSYSFGPLVHSAATTSVAGHYTAPIV